MLGTTKDQYGSKNPTGLFSFTVPRVLLFRVLLFGILLLGVLLLGLLLLAIGWGINHWFFTPQPVAIVEFDEHRCVIEDGFELKWIHSVEKQWWIETYKVEEEQLVLTDTYMQTFGAGTPSTEALGQQSDKYPEYVHYSINTRLPYLNWMVSSHIKASINILSSTQSLSNTQTQLEQNMLLYSLPIYQWVEDYTNIYIYAQQQNLWTLKRQDLCYEYANTT